MSIRKRSAERTRGQPRFNAWYVAAGAGALACIAIVGVLTQRPARPETPRAARMAGRAGCSQVERAFRDHETGNWVTMKATVQSILPDAHGTSTHQRFILKCSGPDDQTVLIENNISVGEPVPVTGGEGVIVHGQYIWNNLGGLIHDTHHATGTTPDGWISAGGSLYQ